MDNTGMMNFWSLMGLLAVLQNVMNDPLLRRLLKLLESWREKKNAYHYFRVPQLGDGYQENEMYAMATTYIGTLKAVADTHYANVYVERQRKKNSSKGKRLLCLENGQSVEDEFMGVKVWWTRRKSSPEQTGNNSSTDGGGNNNNNNANSTKSFEVKMLKKDKEVVIGPYLDHVVAVAEEVERKREEIMLYSNRSGGWSSVPFKHPSTFDTIALDSDLKSSIKSDLDAFLERKSYYHSIGRCWKRGYLFYGPPGTGKSSMIAAMANYLHFDVYDLELSSVNKNSDLSYYIMNTKSKSIIVIEDIDCTLDSVKKRTDDNDADFSSNSDDGVKVLTPTQKENRLWRKRMGEITSASSVGLTLSGILNCMDGLWSCCGEERIFVFTTNNKDKIDPALLRPGRMDFHVYFPHCSFQAFKILAKNYLSIDDHDTYPALKEAFGCQPAALTPAEVAEMLLKHQNEGADNALSSVLQALTNKGLE